MTTTITTVITTKNEKMEKRLEYLKIIADNAKKELDRLPTGSLKIFNSHGHAQYCRCEKNKSGTREYIHKSEESLIKGLARRGYLEKVLKAIAEEIKMIEQRLFTKPFLPFESVYDQMDNNQKKLVSPIAKSDGQFVEEWVTRQYDKKVIDPNDAVYVTDKGDYVRSKSELIIANMLFKRGILYRYECGLFLGGRLIFPDFTLLDIENRREIYWEHFGMMDNPEYAANAIKKMKDYDANGFVFGETLLVSFEAKIQPLSIEQIDRMISRLATSAACVKMLKSA